MRPKNRIGYIGWVGHHNLGDEALFSAFVKAFSEFAVEIIPSQRIKKLSWWRKLILKSRYPAIALGGGTLVFAEYVDVFRNAQKLANYTFLFGTGVEDAVFWKKFNRKWELKDWQTVLNKTNYIGVRGPHSQAMLKEIGVNSEILGDLALIWSYEKFLSKKKNKHILLNLGTSYNHVFGNEYDIFNTNYNLATELIKNNWKITIVSVWPEDNEVVMKFYEKIASLDRNNIYIITQLPSLENYFSIAEQVDIAIGFKLHSVVLAHCVGTPALMMAYRQKCIDYMASMDLSSFCHRTDQLDANILFNQITELYGQLKQQQEHLVYWTNYYKSKIIAKAKEISKEL